MSRDPSPEKDAARQEVEAKRATILFADLVGFGAISERAGVERAYEILTRCLTLLDGVARRHGGAVDKFLGDALLAVFGHPIAVDHPEQRALRAADEMRRLVRDYRASLEEDLPVDVQIGVNTGEILFGDLGDVRREFSILGDAVNVAARLKSKAGPGAIVVGPETRAAAGPGFGFGAETPLALKGKAEPVPACELVEAHEDPTVVGGDALEQTAFVGRREPLARLREAAEGVAAGRGAVRAVTGAAGTGKSRLVAEVARATASLPLRWRLARARAGGRALHPFVPLIRHFAGVAPDDPDDVVRERLRAAFGADAPSTAYDRTLAGLLRVLGQRGRGAGARALEGLAPEAYRSALVASVARVVEALASEAPLVLVLEDWQWADEASRQLLRALSGAAARDALGVIVVGRSLPDLPPGSVETLELAELPPGEAHEMCVGLAKALSLAEETVELVEERGRGNPMGIVLAAFLGPALLADVRRAREDRHRERETERRRATVLFADLSGFTSLSERARPRDVFAAVTGCLERLHQIAVKHGGSVDKHMGDCVMAVFGFPEAMEDAPRAAVNAAIEMRRDVAAFNAERALASPLEVHSGIDTGLAIAGAIEGSVIGEFALLGDAIKSADRLTDLADSRQIYVGEETWRATRDVFDYAEREPYALAGQGNELASYELLSAQEQLHRGRRGARELLASAMVGRDAELAILSEAFAGVREGRGAVVHVEGEAGLGKSRLLAEARGRAAEGLLWLEGRSLSIGRNLPFHPFADALRGFAGVAPDDDEPAAAARVRAALGELLGDEAPDVTPYVLTVMALPLDAGEREQIARLEGDAMENLVRRALVRLLRRLAETRPMVLVLDDLHWADLSSIELLDSLLRLAASHPIAFVHLARAGFADTADRIRASAEATQAERLRTIELQPLGSDACRLLIRNLFRGADVPHALRSTLEERAAGNPFFVEEVVRSLLDEGALALEDGALRATERIADVTVPGTIQEVVMARVDRLAPDERTLVQVASALGASFEPEILAAVVGRPDLDGALADLGDAGLLLRADRRWEFKHPLIQEVAYDSIVEARRQPLHREIGEAIERTLGEHAPGFHARLAYHYGRGRDAERAEEHLFRAGEEAARASASNEALHFFQEASSLYFELHGDGGDPEKKSLLAAQVARAQSNRGLFLEAVSHYDRALGHLGERTPGAVELALRLPPLALALIARLYWPARRLRPAGDRERRVIALMYDRAQAETTTSPTRFVYDTMRVLRNLQRVDPTTVEKAGGIFASAVGTFAFGGVSFAVGHKFLERAEPLVSESDRREVLLLGMMRFLLHLLEGDWDDAHGLPASLVEEGIDLGALWEVSNFLDLDTERRIYRGEFEHAERQLEEIGRIVDLFQYDLAKASHGALRTYLQIERRELEAALDSADRYFDDHAEDSFQVLALGARAKAEVLLGRLDAAGASLERAEGVIERSGSLLPFHRSSYLRSRALLDVARLEQAAGAGRPPRALRRAARRSVGKAAGVARVVAARRPEVFKLAGSEAWLSGAHRRALAWWRRGLEAAEALGARPEWARIAAEVGARLAEPGGPDVLDDADAATWTGRGREAFEALGLQHELDALRARGGRAA